MDQSGMIHPFGIVCASFAVVTTVGAVVKYDDAVRCPTLAGLSLLWLIFSIFLISGIRKQNLQYLRACRHLLMVFEWLSSTFVIAVLVELVVNRKILKIGLKVLLPVAITVMLCFGGIFALCLLIVNEVIRYTEDSHRAWQQKPWSERSLIRRHLLVTNDEGSSCINQN